MFKRFSILIAVFILLAFAPKAYAVKDFYIKNGSQSFFYVNGTSGNVGIGSTNPGELLDIQGTVRTTGFTMSGQTPISGYVLTASDSSGDTTWTAAGTVAGWTVTNVTDVYETLGGNVGIGTTVPYNPLSVVGSAMIGSASYAGTVGPTNGLAVQGNVGIGSMYPGQALDVQGTVRDIGEIINGNISTIGGYTQTGSTANTFTGNTSFTGVPTFSNASNSALFTGGNVGIGSTNPGELLDVQGTIRTTGFTMSGGTPIGGYVLTASDSSGDTTWTAAGTVGGWTVSGNDVYETSGGNVGIGTTITNAGAALSVMNGNVGIGTWKTVNSLDINNNSAIGANYAGIKTAPPNGLIVEGNVGIGTWTAAGGNLIVNGGGNVGINSAWPGMALDVQGSVRISGTVYSTIDSIAVNQTTGTLEVTGNTALGTIAGNVGIGSTAASASLEIVKQASNPLLMLSSTAAGNGDYVIVTPNGNVGIGSTNPGQILDVQGTIRTTNFTMSGQTPIAGYVLTASDSNGDATWTSAGTVSGWTILNGNIYETNSSGNVGIGSTNPGQALDVQGTVRSLGFTTNGAYTQSGSLVNTFTGNTSFTGVPTFSNASNSALFTGGNVGIGSTNPGELLDVQGTIRTTGFTMSGGTPIGGYVLTASDSSGDTTWTYAGSVGPWTQVGTDVYTSGNNVGIGTASPTGKLEIESGNVGIGTWGTPTGGSNNLMVNGNIGIGTSFIGGTGEAALSVMNGNVGIGSVYPGQALDVQGTARLTGFVLTGNGAAAGNVLVSNGVGLGTWMVPTTLSISPGGSPTQLQYNNGGVFAGAANTAVNSNGNIGIGSTVPGQALDVQGTIRTTNFTMSGQTPMTGYVLTSSDSSGDATWSSVGNINYWNYSASGNIGLSTTQAVGIGTTFVGGTGEAALSVMNGNVGIGTWVPSAELQVDGKSIIGLNVNSTCASGNASLNLCSTGDSNGAYSFVIYDANNTNTLQMYADGAAVFNTEALTGTAAGLITALTLTPTFNAGTNKVNALQVNATNTASSADSTLLDLQVSSVSKFNVTVGGNVGIGTTNAFGGKLIVASGNVGISSLTPGQALDVQGTIRTTNFTMSGQTPMTGYVLTSSDSSGDATWSSVGNINYWNYSASGNIGLSTTQAVGIGTTFIGGTGEAALSVMNGNVGIGTWLPGGALVVTNGNVGIGSTVPGQALDVQGTARLTGFVLTGNGAAAGNVLVSNGVGLGTWMVPTTLSISPGGSPTQLQYNNGGVFAGAANTAVNSNGNIGIGSTVPGQALDVQGTIRTTNFTMSGQTPMTGYVLTSSDSSGDATWSSVGNINYWNYSASGNIGLSTTQAVGIGTTFIGGTGEAALSVMNGNVGIGTWVPVGTLDVEGTVSTAIFKGNVGIGTTPISTLTVMSTLNNGNVMVFKSQAGYNAMTYASSTDHQWTLQIDSTNGAGDNVSRVDFDSYNNSYISPENYNNGGGLSVGATSASNFGLYVANPSNGSGAAYFGGNVGIGSTVPGQKLDVQGTIRTTGFTMSGGTPIGGYVLTSSDSSGDATWSSVGNINYWNYSASGNIGLSTTQAVGIGTTFVGGTGEAALSVMNGNVGIGTWVPGGTLDVEGTLSTALFKGNVGIGSSTNSSFPFRLLDVEKTGTGPQFVASFGNTDTGPTTSEARIVFNEGGNTYYQGISAAYNNASPYMGFSISSTSNTWAEKMRITSSGNVGIGSTAPGQVLDVQGTIRTTNFTMSGQTPMTGYVLTSSDSSGDATWSSVGNINYWNYSASGNIGLSTTQAVGIGTTFIGGTGEAALSVMNGNVGIGTWLPGGALVVTNGNVGIGSTVPGQALDVNGTIRTTTTGGVAFGTDNKAIIQPSATTTPDMKFLTNNAEIMRITNGGNVGIGSTVPGQKLDVQGTIRTTNFTMSGGTPVSGYVLTSSDSSGDATWSSVGNINYWNYSASGNIGLSTTQAVGIGTTFVGGTGEAALSVMNGNVGIGTWVPAGTLDVEGTLSTALFKGNVGIGTLLPNSTLSINGSMAVTVVSKTSAYTATASDHVILVSAGSAITITLPAAANASGREYIIKKTDSSANAVTITDNTDLIDGQSSITIIAQYQSYTLVSDGTNWDIV